MACVRRATHPGRGRDVRCDEEGCEFRLITDGSAAQDLGDASQGHCVLQFQLRTRDASRAGYVDTSIGRIEEEPVPQIRDGGTTLIWENVGERFYWPGEDRGVLYTIPDEVNRRVSDRIRDELAWRKLFDRRFANNAVLYRPQPDDYVLDASSLTRFDGGDVRWDGLVRHQQPVRELTREQFEDFLGYQLLDYQWHWVRYYTRHRSK
jgi:hypothetical protein